MGNSKPVQLTIFAPFIGYLIIYNEQVLSYFSLSSLLGTEINSQYAVFWRLFCVYMGLILLGIASIIYQIFCPRQISKYPTKSEFIAGEKPWIANSIFELITKELYGIGYKEYLHQRKIDSGLLDVIDEDDIQKDILQSFYASLDHSKVFLRECCFYMFTFGLIFISIPSILVFFKILKIALEQFIGFILFS